MLEKPNNRGAKLLALAILTGIDEELNAAVLSGNKARIEAGYKMIASNYYDRLCMGRSMDRLDLYHKQVLAKGVS